LAQQQQQQISKIVIPIDGSKNSMDAADYAVKMAERYDSEVAIVHVIHMDQTLQLLGIYGLHGPDLIKKKIEEARVEAQKWFAEISRHAEQRKVRIKTDVIEFPLSVVATIVEYAVSENADVIVIGTRGRSGMSKMLLGSEASGVVTYAPCPVVVVK
jgi:nucleotide-binding universal stress UspA family protein